MSRYGPRIAALARRAERERAALETASQSRDETSVPDTPDEADVYLRNGVGHAVRVYIDARTGGRMIPFTAAEFSALEDAMNHWLECYAVCHGVDLEAEFTVREAAELLLETRNIVDTAQLLTRVPERESATAAVDE